MGISSINPFAIGNIERGYGASTFAPASLTSTKPIKENTNTQGFKGFASTDDIEKASQFLQGNINLSSRVQKPEFNRQTEARGAAWEGFKVPANNGTGELRPQYFENERIFDYNA